MGKAQRANHCDLCLAASHATKDYALVAEGDPDLPSRLKAVESTVAVFCQTGGLIVGCRGLLDGPRMRSAEYGTRRDVISDDADFGMCVQHVPATTPWSNARSEGLVGTVRLGVPHNITSTRPVSTATVGYLQSGAKVLSHPEKQC